MKRDMNLIRQLLMEVEKRPFGEWWVSPKVEGYDEATVMGRIALAEEAGLLQVNGTQAIGNQYPEYYIERFTWQGCEFLDAARDPGTWDKFQSAASKVGGVAMPVAMALLTEFGQAKLRELGILPTS